MHRHRRTFVSVATDLVVSLALVVGVSCGPASSSSRSAVVIVVDLEAGQRWTARGVGVGRAPICTDGIRHVVDGIDPATNDIVPVRVWTEVVADAIESRNATEITLVVEYTCADGSGSFVTRERWGPDTWSIDSGTGAYRALRGAGALSFTTLDYMERPPFTLKLEGVLEQ
jgi:hypothetical protein